MSDTCKVNTGKKNDRTGNFSGRGYRKQLLRGLGIMVPEEVVQAVIDYCSGYSSAKSLYQLYTNGLPTFKAAKQTIYKIQKIYESGGLAGYVENLDSERLASSPEVDTPTQLNANKSIQRAKSDGFRPGVLVQFPAPSIAPAIQRFLDKEQAKFSKVLEKVMENYSLKLRADKRIGTVNLSRVERSH
jgi:hypothetical protein